MIDFILKNPTISIFISTTLLAIIGSAIHTYMRIWRQGQSITQIWKKLHEDKDAMIELHNKDRESMCSEIDELKTVTSITNVQIIDKLDKLAVSVARIEGWIERSKSC